MKSFRDYLGLSNSCSYDVDDVIGRADRFGFQNFCSPDGKTWHAELTDKAAAIKTATYHAMKNCEGSAEKLRQQLDNICEHYKGNHERCSTESRCKREENYICSKSELKDPVAVNLLLQPSKSFKYTKLQKIMLLVSIRIT